VKNVVNNAKKRQEAAKTTLWVSTDVRNKAVQAF